MSAAATPTAGSRGVRIRNGRPMVRRKRPHATKRSRGDGATARVTGACRLLDRAPALQESVTAVQFLVAVTDPQGESLDRDALATTVTRALAGDSLVVTRTRKGRESDDDILPAIRSIVRAAAADNYSWSSTMLAIVKSAPFQMRRSRS